MPPNHILGDYIDGMLHANKGASSESSRPFNHGTAIDPPILESGCVNRILLYPGSFNPPHQGHLDLLRHVYYEAGEDLSIIAAVILPTDDYQLREKLRNEPSPLILERKKRVHLWTGDGLPDWVWVSDKSEEEWRNFRRQLEAATKRDKIDLKFILLAGPDCVGANSMCDPSHWGCWDVITSDISRPVDFRYPSSMRQISGYSMWTRPRSDVRQIGKLVRAKMASRPETGVCSSMKSTQMLTVLSEIPHAVAEILSELKSLWECERLRKPKGMIRFVPCDLRVQTKEAPSSTQIRHLVDAHQGYELELVLENLALNPCILADYIRSRNQT